MLIYVLLFFLFLSFGVHVLSIILYIQTKHKKYFSLFTSTVVSNMIFAISLSIIALSRPEMIRTLELNVVLWLFSGFTTVIILMVKIGIFRKIYKRTRDPVNFHINYFGKKVYEPGIVKNHEILGLVVTIPFFLFIGAYFIARLINFIMTGHI